MSRERRSVAYALLAACAWSASLLYGVSRGMHESFPEPRGRHALSIAVAVSDLRGLDGYLAYTRVIDALSPLTESNDPARRNAALSRASTLDSPAAEGTYLLLREDKGYATYAKLAFRLFGTRVSSLYAMYFLLLLCSSVLFWVSHRRQAAPLCALTTVLAAHLPVMALAGATGSALDTVYNSRFLPVLAGLPCMHLAWMALGRSRATIGSACAAAGQALLIAFVLHVRSSAVYVVLFLLALQAALLLGRARPIPTPFRLALRRVRWLPLALVLGAVAGQKAHLLLSLSPRYSGTSVEHLFWHTVYLGLSAHPASLARHGIAFDDQIAFDLGKRLARERHDASLSDRYYFDNALYESVLREEYLRIVREDPLFTIWNYLRKPLLFLSALGDSARSWPVGWLIVPLLASLAAGWLGGPPVLRQWRELLGLPAAACCFALLPAVLAMPEPYLIADPSALLLSALLAAAAISAAALAAREETLA